jgi:Lipid A 3-O-deacylase (PagL)
MRATSQVVLLLALLSLPSIAASDPEGWWWKGGAGYGAGVDVNDGLSRYELDTGVERRLSRALSFDVELGAVRFQGVRDGRDAAADGVVVIPRLAWHFARLGGSSLLLDFGLGGALFSRDFPPGGTRLNGYSAIGVGARLALTEELQAFAALRLMHHSNGKGLVADNPAFDGVAVSLGFAARVAARRSEAEPPPVDPREVPRVRLLEVRGYAGLHSAGYSTVDGATQAFYATRASLGASLSLRVKLRLDGLLGQFSSGPAAAASALRAYYQDARFALGASAGHAWLEGGLTSETFALHAERYEHSWLTVASSVGLERKSFGDDLRFAELALRLYPTSSHLISAGFSYAVSSLKQTRADILVRVEHVFGDTSAKGPRLAPSLYVQWGGNLYTKAAIGLAFTFDGLTPAARERRDGLFAARFD